MSGPIIRTGTTPDFWTNYDLIFGRVKASSKSAKSTKKPHKRTAKQTAEKLVSIRRPQVFLSYSHADRRFVRALADSLRANEIEVWIDELEIMVGESLLSKLQSAIHEVDFVIPVLSESSIKSEWVRHELEIAMTREISSKRVTVLPAVRDNCKLPPFVSNKLWADFRRPYKRQFGIKALCDAIRRLQSGS